MLEFYEKIAKLAQTQDPFAIVQVVGRQAPSSSKLGDKAVVKRNGRMEGWIGGGCVQGIVLKESADAIASGKPRLVRIGKELQNHQKQEGVMEYRMTCQSEGQVEIYIEPVLPRPHLMVIGRSEIAKAVVRLGKAMDFKVTGVSEGANLQTYDKVDELITQLDLSRVNTSRLSFIVVATQGDRDEESLLQALKKESSYVGFISSRKKAASISNYLIDAGVDPTSLEKLHAPAGLDINAKKPDEVAVSIMAEIIGIKNGLDLSIPAEEQTDQAAETPSYYINPVCGVPVDIKHPKHVIQYREETVYFCCDGCKIKFEKDPDKYMRARAEGLPPEGM